MADRRYALIGHSHDGLGTVAAWGSITGTLSDQTDLQSALDAKAASAHTHVIADVTDFTDNSANWNTAYGWGDHGAAGYALDSTVVHLAGTETITGAKTFNGGVTITSAGTEALTLSHAGTVDLLISKSGSGDLALSNSGSGDITIGGAVISSTLIGQWDTAYGWGDHSSAGYAADSAVVHLAGTETITGYKTFSHASGILIGAAPLTATLIGQWDTAYGWGDHASGGYAADSAVVHKTGAETIAGAKNFSTDCTISGTRLFFTGFTGYSGNDFVFGFQPGAVSKRVAFYDYQNARDGVVWNLDAQTWAFRGALSVTGALTAVSYGGITEANLVDKSATETVTGTWNFSSALTASRLHATGLSTSWGSTSGINTGAINAVMGTSSNATWLISGTSGGTFRGGIQILDSGTTARLYANSNYLFVDSVGPGYNGAYIPTVSSTSTITGARTYTAQPAMRYGISGDYTEVGGAGTFGATIWSIDSTYQGGSAGANSINTSVYGIRWLRSGHASALAAVGEGLYIVVNGSIRSAIGYSGLYSSGTLELGNAADTTISRVSAGKIEVEGRPVYMNESSSYDSGRIHFSTSAPTTEGSNGDIWFEYT